MHVYFLKQYQYIFSFLNFQHRTYAHIFDSVKQDWFAVASVLENLLSTLKKQLPKIKTVFLRSDNAGCYHCGNLWLALHGISERTGKVSYQSVKK